MDEGSELEAFVDGVVAAHMRQHRTPGVAVSLVRGGRVLFAKGYGLADVDQGKPVRGADTRFRIASVSKTFVWTAVMMLVERRELDLDADINTYLKDLKIPATFEQPVTMNHLMAHRAGFEQTLAVFLHADDGAMSLTEALEHDMPERVFVPGTRTSYSNYGASIAAKIVSDVSGVPYDEFLQDEILTPLHMANTTLQPSGQWPTEQVGLQAIGYNVESGVPQPADEFGLGPYAPVGGIASTAEDMARWMLLHLAGGTLDGERLLSPETHQELWTRAFQDRMSGADVAHGFQSIDLYGHGAFGHGGSLSGFYSNLVVVPDLELGVFVSQNASDDRALIHELPSLILGHLLAQDAVLGETSVGEEQAQRSQDCVGEFRSNRRSFTKFEKAGAIESVASVTAGAGGRLFVTWAGEVVEYLPLAAAADTYQDSFGNRIVFGRDESGAVSHFSGPNGVHSYERIAPLDSSAAIRIAMLLAALFSGTTWLGVLWRRGVPTNQTISGKHLGHGALAATAAFLVLVGAAAWATRGAGSEADYPNTAFSVLRAALLVFFVVSNVCVLCLLPVWRSSGWCRWRKLHFTLLALSFAGLAYMHLHWNLVFAPFSV